MIVVVDSNAAIEVVLKREKGTRFRQIIESAEKTISSEFFRIETANVISKYCRGNYIKKDECHKLLELTENLIDEYVPIAENNLEALHESIRLSCSAYDMLYLTLARRTGAVLMTLDRLLGIIAEKEGIAVTR
ncbi:MAG: type II toxin-antitoxin system VapC family toxin [Treponema sp.]|jgi:predicted nucleic acid-binding protein|nr:type II toxin-antitoxin system VapC family toxin [Treponema sp.]